MRRLTTASQKANTMEKEIKKVTTTKGILEYYREWDNSYGGIVMINPRTIKRYKELKNSHPDTGKYGVFFAFSKNQFKEGYDRLVKRGFIEDGDKIQYTRSGMYGTKGCIERFYRYYDTIYAKIKEECDPQEVYFYEYNNHECQISLDGDLDAINIIKEIYGEDIADYIKRF